MNTLETERREASSGTAKWLIVFLHGYGSNGAELIRIADLWQSSLPDAAFAAPNGPITVNEPLDAYAWAGRRPPGDPRLGEEIAQTAPQVDSFLDAELNRVGLGADRLALVGFSQGTVMALHVGLRRNIAPFAVLGYAGGLIGHEALKEELKSRPPVMLLNGELDQVSSFYGMRQSVKALEELGVTAHGEMLPGLGHELDVNAMILGGRFLVSTMAYRDKHGTAS